MIIVYLSGGLGNQMFQYAFGRYLSLKHEVPLKLDISLLNDKSERKGFTPREYDLPVFNIQAEIAAQADIPFLYRRYFSGRTMRILEAVRRKIFPNPGKEKHFQFDSEMKNLGPDVYLEGYWQSPQYFSEIENVIRSDFTLHNPLSDKSQVLYDEISRSNSVCIFVRRADYVGNPLHDTVTSEYYDKALSLLQEKNTINKLYIFSDDIEWCQEHMHYVMPHMFVDNQYAGKQYEEKMILMSACKYFIIANSTFAWWGAWLSRREGKIVIAPKQWFGDASINTSDVTPPEWIRI